MSYPNREHKPPPGPPSNQYNVFDPNQDTPKEPPPSYDESIQDPSVPNGEPASYNRPENPLPQRPQGSFNEKYQPPPTPPVRHAAPPQPNQPQLPKPTPTNPNPYLPWRYSSTHRCSKCENTGFKTKNGKPCKKCWKYFRRGIEPPNSQAELERLVKHAPPPKLLNPNVHKLPPGTVSMGPMGMPMGGPMGGPMMPQIVQPGDPRIGGIPCPRCNGRGLVHFFLDLERCTTCNGIGRVNFNGRPL